MTYCDCGDYCAWCRPDLCVPIARRFSEWSVSVNRAASGASRLSVVRFAQSPSGRRFVMRASADGLTFLRDADALAFAKSRGYVSDVHA